MLQIYAILQSVVFLLMCTSIHLQSVGIKIFPPVVVCLHMVTFEVLPTNKYSKQYPARSLHNLLHPMVKGHSIHGNRNPYEYKQMKEGIRERRKKWKTCTLHVLTLNSLHLQNGKLPLKSKTLYKTKTTRTEQKRREQNQIRAEWNQIENESMVNGWEKKE